MNSHSKQKILVIAEAGVNHNGSLELAKQLIDVAADAQADFVKFQTFKADSLASKQAQKARYQKQNTNNHEQSQYEMLKALELSEAMHVELITYCQKKNIHFLSTPFDEASADYLESLVPLFKVPSGELTNHPFLIHLAQKRKPIILSTGMSNLSEVEEAVAVILKTWQQLGYQTDCTNYKNLKLPNLTALHCTTAYPTPMDQANLKAITTMSHALKLPIGYSDHTLGLDASIAAVALGAQVIEKHFTLDRNLPGPDHKASLEPAELKALIQSVRNVEQLLGDGQKVAAQIEIENISIARKSLFYANDLAAGHTVTRQDLIAKRPATGLAPKKIFELIGKQLNTGVSQDTLVEENHFKR